MIRVRLFGQLGNQMFQYAFARQAAERASTRFWFSTRHANYSLHFFEVPFPVNLLERRWFRALNKRTEGLVRLKTVHDYSNGTFDSSGYEYTTNADYLGYFQDSGLYAQKEVFRTYFKIKPVYRRLFESKYLEVFQREKTLTVQVRLGDYRNERMEYLGGVDPLLPLDWYKRQLQQFDLDGYKVFVVSNEPDICREEFCSIHPNISVPGENFITEFQFLMHSDVCIISNSTFAWWGAYLNGKKGVRIIAPRYWMGYNAKQEFPKGIMNIDFDWTD